MPKHFSLAALLGRSSGDSEEDGEDTKNEAAITSAAELGARLATLTAENAQLKAGAETAETQAKEARESATASLEALKAEAKTIAVVAYGAGSASLAAETAIIEAAGSAPLLSALIARYRAAMPSAFRDASGQRQTQAQTTEQPREEQGTAAERREKAGVEATSVVDRAFGKKKGS